MSSETLSPAGEVEAREHVKANANPEGIIVREFAAQITAGDGRTVDVRIVPYGEQIQHDDGVESGTQRGQMYREEFMPGVFSHQLNAASRIQANVEHEEGINAKVGHGVLLREEADGFHGSFRILETQAGETALQLIRAGSLDGVSMEAIPVKSVRTRDGVIQRVKANLRDIAFTRFGAYRGARVLAIREEAIVVDEQMLPVDLDPELIERCRRLGLKLPQRYEAHPDEPGTPDTSGTPEDGTRPQTENIPTVEDEE